MCASQIRAIARKALQGTWGVALLVTLVAVILGGVNAAVSPSITMQAGDTFDAVNGSGGFHQHATYIPFDLHPAFAESFAFFGVIAALCGVIALIIGGAVRQGLCQFNINLIKKDARCCSLFRASSPPIAMPWRLISWRKTRISA